jgi:hypothetical protein
LVELMTVHSKKQHFVNVPTQSQQQQVPLLHLAFLHRKRHPSQQNLPLQAQ